MLPLAAAFAATCPQAQADSVRLRLDALSVEHGFTVRGIEKLGDEPEAAASGDLAHRLRALLAGYDHVVDAPGGEVERVIVLGAKRSRPDALVVQTARVRGHHAVAARIEGAQGQSAEVDLIIDSGATTVVLPESMIEPLGFDAATLPQSRGQTVNGPVVGRVATLAEVRVGGAVGRDVSVLFVPDEGLAGVALLGMSFLRDFSFTLDDAGSRLVLRRR